MPAQRTPATAGISAREAEVLTAVGEHLTNVEIGSRLFISVRTVESHVSSLLRKLQVEDRRALAAISADLPADAPGTAVTPVRGSALPSPLTPFVGRVAERAALVDAMSEAHRLVTAVGPGGVGKTRLVLNVATEVRDQFADGVWYVDLVPVTDPQMVAPAIADALGLGEGQLGSATDNLLAWLGDRQTLLVLDNCEHLLDGVGVVLERLLAGSPRMTVLATSRSRLLLPFEWVFSVPGLSVEADDGGPGDAITLFLERAAAGGRPLTPEDERRIAAVCRGLDGMALAIELAAARYASLGLDGLEAGLHDRLRLLAGGSRIDDRHRSLRSTIDWSYALLDEADQALLRRVSVFTGPFDAATVASVLPDWAPVADPAIPSILAGLTDQSLLVAQAQPDGTRYQALETIRQYGGERLEEAGESTEAHVRHVRWCLDECARLERGWHQHTDTWRPSFDAVADELRGALTWATGTAAHRHEAHLLATALARLTFARGLPGESQRRYEQAAALAPNDPAAAHAWRGAAGAAESRHIGNDALSLRRYAADAALRAGDRAGAAGDLARSSELINRGPGLMATAPSPGAADALLAEARKLAGTEPAALARVATAEAFNAAISDPATADLVERAISLAHGVGDPLLESAALDQLTALHLARGDVRDAAASTVRRTQLLESTDVTATSAFEFFDAYVMAADCAVAAGDLVAARELSERLRDLPFYREEGHLANARLLVVMLLAGDWDDAVTLAERYREGWERAGRPRAGNLTRGAYAAATVHGLRGDDVSRTGWLTIVDALVSPGRSMAELHFGEFFDALLLLHRGRAAEATDLLEASPENFVDWYDGLWRSWYAALWAEAAVLSGHEEAASRLDRAREVSRDNPIATAVIERAAALSRGADGRDDLVAAATALEDSGCRYQWARTLVLLGGEDRVRGEQLLATMGAAPMAWPPG